MSLLRRSLTVATVLALASAGLGVSASAEDDPSAGVPGRPDVVQEAPDLAVGLIVKTTTKAPSDALLEATDDALGSEAEVTDDAPLSGKISTIDFDETVSADTATEAAAEVEKRADVVWAAPNGIRRASVAPPIKPKDPLFPKQWNLWDSSYASAAYSIKAPSLWQATTGSSAVTVAVLDTGVLKNHPDLQGQLVDGYDTVRNDDSYKNDNNDGTKGPDTDASDPGDFSPRNACGSGWPGSNSSWHGTFVAGQIAAKHNTTGISGVAPSVKIQPVRVLGRCGGTDADIMAGMIWASGGTLTDSHYPAPTNSTPAQVVNMSLSGQVSSTQRRALCTAYGEITANAPNTLFVAAAGNDFASANYSVPSSCPGIISVGATSHKGFSSVYSNVGSSVDISAPGGDSTVEGSGDVITSLGNAGGTRPGANTYVTYEGTSMAAPQVAAGAALLNSLGLKTRSEMTNGLYAAAAPFRARVSSYAKKKVRLNGENYVADLNCRGHDWCGRGILNLARVEAPITAPTLAGTPTIGEPLTAVPGRWVKKPTFRYQWFRYRGLGVEAIAGATSATYYPTRQDIGAVLYATLRPSTAAFAKFTTTTAQSAPVPDGPEVTLSLPSSGKYGAALSTQAIVTVNSSGAQLSGPVELRRGSKVVATGTAVDGVARIKVVPGPGWAIGSSNPIRAAYVGATKASSPLRTVTVAKATSSIKVAWPSAVKHTTHAKVTATVTTTGHVSANGSLYVYDGKKRIITASLSSTGKRTFTLPLLKKGTHRLSIRYSGSSTVVGKTSTSKSVRSR